MRKRNYVIGALAVAVAAVLPAGASAAVTSQTIKFAANPAKASKSPKTPTPVSVRVDTDSTWDAYGPAPTAPTPATTDADIDFDNDFVFNTKGIPTCNPTSLAGTTTAAAVAVCGSSQVGSGSATLNGAVGPRTAVVTAFNGTPVNGQPQLLLHTRLDSLNITQILPGVLQTSPLGGDYGKRLHVDVPAAQIGGGFEVITHFDTTVSKPLTIKKKVGKKTVKVKSGYVVASCRDKNRTWNISSVFSFGTVSSSFAPTSMFPAVTTQTCRAAKVKKKK